MRPQSTDAIGWGRWILQRSHHIGFRRNADLAAAIGCSGDQLARWLKMGTPPDKIRNGFDARIAQALRTDGITLFTNYPNVSPQAAPIRAIDPRTLSGDADSLRRRVGAIAELLPGELLQKYSRIGEGLLRGNQPAA